MILSGQWDPQMDTLIEALFGVDDRFKATIQATPNANLKTAVCELYTSVSAISSTIARLCKEERPCSSQVVGSLMRTLIEACVAVFAFCRDPARRAELYVNFSHVLKFKGQIRLEKHPGCPFSPPVDAGIRAQAKAEVRSSLLRVGQAYVEKSGGTVEEATRPGSEKPGWFRRTWYPERREEILAGEKMGWVNDVLYNWLCSSVHSDTWASQCFAGLDRNHAATLAMQLWGAAAWRLAEVLGIELAPIHVKTLRDAFYRPLQWDLGIQQPQVAP